MIDTEGFMLNFWFKHGLNIKPKTPKNDHKTKESHFCNSLIFSGTNWNRTNDTRIFSPLLYQLSYGTMFISFAVAKVVKLLDYAIAFIIKNADNWLYG